jgi:hypothetical protein
VIEPAIQAEGNRQAISEELKDAGSAWLAGDAAKAKMFLKRAGVEAQRRVQGWFFDPRNRWPALKPETVARKGSSQPLIDTAAMYRSIRWVLRGDEGAPTAVQRRQEENVKLGAGA